MAVNCEFLPLAIPHYKLFGGSYYYLFGQSVGHKNPAKRFICGYCVVKIPDWKSHRGFSNLPRSASCDKAEKKIPILYEAQFKLALTYGPMG